MTSKTISINFNEILSEKKIPLSDVLLSLIRHGNHGNNKRKNHFGEELKKVQKFVEFSIIMMKILCANIIK